MKRNAELYHSQLKCLVKTIHYDYASRSGKVVLFEDQNCDMSGAVAIFETIDPRVQLIDTYVDEQRDTSYRKIDGHWVVLARPTPQKGQE